MRGRPGKVFHVCIMAGRAACVGPARRRGDDAVQRERGRSRIAAPRRGFRERRRRGCRKTARLTPREVAGYHSAGRCGRACLVPTMCWRQDQCRPCFPGGLHGQTPFRGRLRRHRRRAGDRIRAGAGGLPLPRRHLHQSVPARRRRRRGGAPAGGGAGADPQAAGGDRDQGRRGRPGRRPVRSQRQARRLHAAHAHRLDLRLRRGRQAVRPARRSSRATTSSPSPASSPTRWCSSSTTSSPTRR